MIMEEGLVIKEAALKNTTYAVLVMSQGKNYMPRTSS